MPTIKKALITGGSGFVGSHIVEELVKKNFKVIVLDIKKPKTKNVVFVKNKNFSLKSLKKLRKKLIMYFIFQEFLTSTKLKTTQFILLKTTF